VQRPAGGPRRILVTGSRTWTDVAPIRAALATVWGDGTAVLVSGACPRGADHIADAIWASWGGRVERHPADWSRYGRAAGYRCNAAMVAAGGTECLAFIHVGSAGASHTTRLAEDAGIPHPPPRTGAGGGKAMTTARTSGDAAEIAATGDLLTVEEAAQRLSLGRTTLYALLKDGQITSVRIGRLRRIPVGALVAYTARLLAEQNVA